jgi:hypothetical protein
VIADLPAVAPRTAEAERLLAMLRQPTARPQPREFVDANGLTLPPDKPGALWRHPQLGNIYLPKPLRGQQSYGPGPLRNRFAAGEVGVVVVCQRRPIFDESGRLLRYEMVMWDVSHNERVDRGALRQDLQMGWGGTPSTTHIFTTIAVANAALTVAKGNESLGTNSADVTTNEFTTIGLSRALGTPSGYVAPSALGTQFTRVLSKQFTASGSGTAKGSGVFSNTTVVGSFLYCQDNHTDAVLVSSDLLTEQWTFSN